MPEVVGPNGDTIGSFSTVGGEVSVPNLEPGNYTVYERVPPKYYLLSDEPARNVTVKTGETATLTYDNEPFGSLRIEKVSDTGDRLPGVTIQIKHIESGRTYAADGVAVGANNLENCAIQQIQRPGIPFDDQEVARLRVGVRARTGIWVRTRVGIWRRILAVAGDHVHLDRVPGVCTSTRPACTGPSPSAPS